MENWKDIKGYEGLYQISDKGIVKSIDRVVKGKHYKETILQPCINKGGYCRVHLNNPPKNYLVHRLVAEHFIDNPYNYEDVNHKDENKTYKGYKWRYI